MGLLDNLNNSFKNNELIKQSREKILQEDRATAAAQGDPDASGMPTIVIDKVKETEFTEMESTDHTQNIKNPNGNEIRLKYPFSTKDSGTQHIMRIRIFTQNISPMGDKGIVDQSSWDATRINGEGRYSASSSDISTGTSLNIGAKSLQLGTQLLSNYQQAAFAAGSPTRSLASKWGATFASVGADAANLAASGLAAINFSKMDLTKPRVSNQNICFIDLYMPETLNFVNNQDFDAVSLTEALGQAGRLSQMGGISNPEIGLEFLKDAGAVGERYRDFYLQNTAGYALNPQLEILYNGPKQREFVFNFRFTPRGKSESMEVDKIIKTLRFHSAPEYSVFGKSAGSSGQVNSRYVVPPSQFSVDFYDKGGASPNKYLPRIGKCALTSVDVNYAPSGRYAAFKDGSPAEIGLQLSFTELVVLTKKDILAGY